MKVVYTKRFLKLFLLNSLFLFLPLLSCSNNSVGILNGQVQSGGQGLPNATVTLFSTGFGEGPQNLGTISTDSEGFFVLSYPIPSDPNTVLYLITDSTPLDIPNLEGAALPIRLATVLGTENFPSQVIINERSTAATAFAMAQFSSGAGFDGLYPGIQNSAATLQNLVNISTGEIGEVLATSPNGSETTTLATLNSLANLLASCVQSSVQCPNLFQLTTPPAGETPQNTLQAALNIAHFPWQNVTDLRTQSQQQNLYQPSLATEDMLDAWTLAIRYVGNGEELDGPGFQVFDEDGNVWICNNYVFSLDPLDPEGMVCGGQQVLKFTPTGEDFPGAPYEGGGVYGAGFGIALDPSGDVWVANFAFQGANCPFSIPELSQTVSLFSSEGVPLSPDSQGNETGADHGGYQGAGNTISRPQGMVSDVDSNIWTVNCGGGSVTVFPQGDPNQAYAIAPTDDLANPLLDIPFAITMDPLGHAWVTSNENASVFAFDLDGNVVHSLTDAAANAAGIFRPMGIASDSVGNIWVANSGIIRPPCDQVTAMDLLDAVEAILMDDFVGANASVTLITPDGNASAGSPYQGGGLLVPWGIAVDGNDNVWVANFGGSRVSQICGARPETCPPGFQTGDPISPDNGYSSNGLTRNTGVAIDPSGNVWLANNWRHFPNQQNPGGHEMVVFIGLAKPVKAPLIGPPQSY